ncbi:uncharacterized histidine-rich protein DDB_G0274557-like [Pogonomyrmex barbatus]|uniref:Uncharacterized histidine-rich protein DDB_G0274557-like n=1 Tax=Pogonomyrmex barbatus TaxID=144034 RepID=A0A8N1S9S2_9HYME|nr:uncharacterized histidine-rich protein DDB_G0274557-like [Pogonomyrmex barbatus]
MNLTSFNIFFHSYETHNVNRLHSGSQEPHRPGRLRPIDNGYAYKRLLHPHSLSLDAMHLLPYVDSASWLYLDPNPIYPLRLPSLECDASLISEQHRHHHHHHHYHHYHRHHSRQRKHRRVLSDPGGWDAGIRMDATRHRRVLSSAGADLMRASIDEANEDDLSPEEETRASTFRKVPWHPNLHMLKIRRT